MAEAEIVVGRCGQIAVAVGGQASSRLDLEAGGGGMRWPATMKLLDRGGSGSFR